MQEHYICSTGTVGALKIFLLSKISSTKCNKHAERASAERGEFLTKRTKRLIHDLTESCFSLRVAVPSPQRHSNLCKIISLDNIFYEVAHVSVKVIEINNNVEVNSLSIFRVNLQFSVRVQ